MHQSALASRLLPQFRPKSKGNQERQANLNSLIDTGERVVGTHDIPHRIPVLTTAPRDEYPNE